MKDLLTFLGCLLIAVGLGALIGLLAYLWIGPCCEAHP